MCSLNKWLTGQSASSRGLVQPGLCFVNVKCTIESNNKTLPGIRLLNGKSLKPFSRKRGWLGYGIWLWNAVRKLGGLSETTNSTPVYFAMLQGEKNKSWTAVLLWNSILLLFIILWSGLCFLTWQKSSSLGGWWWGSKRVACTMSRSELSAHTHSASVLLILIVRIIEKLSIS